MKLYLSAIGIDVLVLSGVVAWTCHARFITTLLLTLLATVSVICIDGILAAVCRLLPRQILYSSKKIFRVSGGEKNFYEKIKIRKWKDKLPELGHLTGFRKNKLEDGKNLFYVERFILEAWYGEVVHFVGMFAGLFLLLFPFGKTWTPIAVCVAVINAFLNLPFIFIQRYNTYKLSILRKSLQRKENQFLHKAS